MKKNYSFILLISCFTIVFGQKKKQKSLPPPKAEALVTESKTETDQKEEIQYIAPPASANGFSNNAKPKIIENLNLDSNAKKCACDNPALILAVEQLDGGITLKDFGLKGSIKIIKNVEKRDTLVGYSETLSKGNTVEMQFSENGLLNQYSIQDTKQKYLKSKSILHYNTNYRPTFIESFYGDNLKPVKHIFQYNEQGLYGILLELESKIHNKIYECSKTENEFFVVKKEIDEERNNETNEMYVFNTKNQLIKKQEISNNDGNTTNNKTKTFVYNNSGLLTEENFLKNDGTIRSYIHHQYNPQGDVIKSVDNDGDYIIYDYKYDNQNNWIWKRKTSYEKSRFSNEMQIDERLTWDRTISYY